MSSKRSTSSFTNTAIGMIGISDSDESVVIPYTDWKAAYQTAWKAVNEETGSNQCEIPDSHLQDLYERYEQLVHSIDKHVDQNLGLFFLGVWAAASTKICCSETLAGPGLNGTTCFSANPSSAVILPPKRDRTSPVDENDSVKRKRVDNIEIRDILNQDSQHSSYTEDDGGAGGASNYNGSLEVYRGVDYFQPLPFDALACQLFSKFGITLDPIAQAIFTDYVGAKMKLGSVIERIAARTTDESKVHSFVEQLSHQVCWVTDDVQVKFLAQLLMVCFQRKIISKPKVIQILKSGIIEHLPELMVKVRLDVTARVADFVCGVFVPKDLIWFFHLTDDLRKNFFPVWKDFFQKTIQALKRRMPEENVKKLLNKTPCAQPYLQFLI